MKKTMLVIVLTFIFLRCLAPIPIKKEFFIPKSEPIYIYNMDDPLLRTVAYIESRFQPHVVNKHSGARGLLQITKPMIRAVNKVLQKYDLEELQFTWKDAFDPEKSISMWYIFQTYYNPEYDPRLACKLWFGSGVQWDGMTWVDYFELVEDRL